MQAMKPSSTSPPKLTHFKYRFLNFANPSRALATEDPTFEDFLPIDDDHFHDAVRHNSFPFAAGWSVKATFLTWK
jgi:hypothetical protein